MGVSRWAGLLIPLFVFVVFILGIGVALDSNLTWERPFVYLVTLISLILGQIALVKMARNSVRDKPSLFLLVLNYENAALLVVVAAILEIAMQTLYPGWNVGVSESVLFGLLVASLSTISLTRLVLFFGRMRGWIAAPVDPNPAAFFHRSKIDEIAQKQDDHIALTNERFFLAEKQAEEVQERLDASATEIREKVEDSAAEMEKKFVVAVEEREAINHKLDSILKLLDKRD